MIVAVSSVTKDVVVPLVAAGITAIGIALPILLFRRQELAKVRIQSKDAESVAVEREIAMLRNDAFLLRELFQRFGLETKRLTSSQQRVIESARDRAFQRIYANQRLFESIVPSGLNSSRRAKKLMLVLGELDSRLGNPPFTPAKARDPVTVFGIYTLCYLLETNEEERAEDFSALTWLATQDPETELLFSVLFEE